MGDLRLKEITISGFRGYSKNPETLDLSHPIVILFGGNRSGKSSTLNAVEWALYGDAVVGKGKIGIEERKDWCVCNLRCEAARVELVLSSTSGEIRIYRECSGKKKRRGQGFRFVDETGQTHEDEERLWKTLGAGPRDFMSGAYLHQEVVRDIIISTPSVRREALDRLLGISDLRNLFDALKGIRIRRYEDEIGKIYERVETLIEMRAQTYKENLEEVTTRAKSLGLERDGRSPEGLAREGQKILEALDAVAAKAGVTRARLELPSRIEACESFGRVVRGEIDRLRIENPGSVSQHGLDAERRALDEALSEYLGARQALLKLQREKKRIESEHGSAKELLEKKKRLEETVERMNDDLARIGDRLPVVMDTVTYLKKLEEKRSKTPCPSCGQDIVPEDLLPMLEKLIEGARAETEHLEKTRKETKRSIKERETSLELLAEIEKHDLPAATRAQDTAIDTIEGALGKKIGLEDDVEFLAKRRIAAIQGELEKNKKVLEAYHQELSKVMELLERVTSIGEVLRYQGKIRTLNAMKTSKEWAELNGTRDRLNEEITRVERVKATVEEVLREESQTRLAQVRGRLSTYYQKLVERPDFDEIEIDPEDCDVYAVKGDTRQQLVTFFNQGDMNCAALSIFLALGARAGNGGGLSFIMLDDPSQSLDGAQKARLVRLLDEEMGETQIILSTMDGELMKRARETLTRKKKIYELGEWDPVNGPSIEER